MRKAHNLLWAHRGACRAGWGLRHKVVHWLYVAIIWPTISFASLVWWPGCQMASAKKKLSRSTKTGMLRDNGSDSYDSYWCYEDARWPPSTGSGDRGGGKVGSTQPLEFGVLVLTSPPTRTQLYNDLTSGV